MQTGGVEDQISSRKRGKSTITKMKNIERSSSEKETKSDLQGSHKGAEKTTTHEVRKGGSKEDSTSGRRTYTINQQNWRYGWYWSQESASWWWRRWTIPWWWRWQTTRRWRSSHTIMKEEEVPAWDKGPDGNQTLSEDSGVFNQEASIPEVN